MSGPRRSLRIKRSIKNSNYDLKMGEVREKHAERRRIGDADASGGRQVGDAPETKHPEGRRKKEAPPRTNDILGLEKWKTKDTITRT